MLCARSPRRQFCDRSRIVRVAADEAFHRLGGKNNTRRHNDSQNAPCLCLNKFVEFANKIFQNVSVNIRFLFVRGRLPAIPQR